MTNVYVGRNGDNLQIPSALFLVLCNRSLSPHGRRIPSMAFKRFQVSLSDLSCTPAPVRVLRSISGHLLSSYPHHSAKAAIL